ncbi:MAG: hypothetical protein HY726_21570 [Candidatus Rokubacteria bacterium]|nr:hypothetical protein [Candidatus Rokubacteria bacterium]
MGRRAMRRSTLAACLAVALLGLAPTASAQLPANVMLLRGTIASAEPAALSVKTKEGVARVALTEKTGYSGVLAAKVEEIKPGEYVGITAKRGAGGGWEAVEVHIFPEAMRGLSEGHYPWDFPGTTMTNAVIAEVVQKVDGPLLTLTPKGQSVQIRVPSSATIVRVEVRKADAVQVGAGTVVVARKGDDGSLTALRVYVGQGGVMPPF